MQPLHSGIIFLLGSLKTWTWKLSPILPPTITENHKNVSKVGPRRLPKSTLKSLKLDLRAHLAPNSEKTPTDGTPNTSGVDPRGVWSDHWASRPPFGCPLGTKFRENSDRYLVPGRWYVPGTWYQVPGTRHQGPGTRYQVPGARYLVPRTWYQVPGTRYQVPGNRYQVPARLHIERFVDI